MEVNFYKTTSNGVQIVICDTPGLCDAEAEKENDYAYLNLMRTKVPSVDCAWYFARLDETRVSQDEKSGIKLISKCFPEIWKQAVIVFTFASNVKPEKYLRALQMRTAVIRREISAYAGGIAANIPSVAVDNDVMKTPDGDPWLGRLLTESILRADNGIPLLMSTVHRIITPSEEAEAKEEEMRKARAKEEEIRKAKEEEMRKATEEEMRKIRQDREEEIRKAKEENMQDRETLVREISKIQEKSEAAEKKRQDDHRDEMSKLQEKSDAAERKRQDDHREEMSKLQQKINEGQAINLNDRDLNRIQAHTNNTLDSFDLAPVAIAVGTAFGGPAGGIIAAGVSALARLLK
eukprot:GHVO01046273.1.p1 GENE.GHVO01046273.1~~GHVO01046273.1.p1  ORF type:complete len:374 (+),score=46.64 GHVO01046273.1:76-1122(+)